MLPSAYWYLSMTPAFMAHLPGETWWAAHLSEERSSTTPHPGSVPTHSSGLTERGKCKARTSGHSHHCRKGSQGPLLWPPNAC